jgi:hypothetical protein
MADFFERHFFRPVIVKGHFRSFRFFDVAEAIKLESVRALLGHDAAQPAPTLTHRGPEYARAQSIPLVESLEPLTLPTGETLHARIKYYWFGVAVVELTTGFECDFDALCAKSYRWMNAPEVEKAGEELLRSRLERFRPSLIRPSPKWLDEDYLVIDVQSVEGAGGHPITGAEMLESHGDQITQIVRGELAPLSASERDEVVGSALSYYPTDLVVVGWGAALVYDQPDASPAMIDLIEYANTQLLEFRYYDELLTNLLSNVYSSLEGHESFMARWRLPRRAGRLNRIRLDIMDLTERTEFAAKFISDTYYARVYRVGSAKIGVDDYKALVADKLKTAGELYEFMVAQFNELRMFTLEVVVAVLVLLDVILVLRGK